jgi:hypothetical protein
MLQSWWASKDAEAAEPRLPQLYSFFHWLDGEQREQLVAELLQADMSNVVGRKGSHADRQADAYTKYFSLID